MQHLRHSGLLHALKRRHYYFSSGLSTEETLIFRVRSTPLRVRTEEEKEKDEDDEEHEKDTIYVQSRAATLAYDHCTYRRKQMEMETRRNGQEQPRVCGHSNHATVLL